MKAVRVSKVKANLDFLSPNDKVWISTTEPLLLENATLEEVEERRKTLLLEKRDELLEKINEIHFELGEDPVEL